jgi:hypothetical protein
VVRSKPAREPVVAPYAAQQVVAPRTAEGVVAVLTEQDVRRVGAGQRVVGVAPRPERERYGAREITV